jgi:hypothetical protein
VIALQKYYKQTEADKGAYQKLVDEFVEAEAERQYKMIHHFHKKLLYLEHRVDLFVMIFFQSSHN